MNLMLFTLEFLPTPKWEPIYGNTISYSLKKKQLLALIPFQKKINMITVDKMCLDKELNFCFDFKRIIIAESFNPQPGDSFWVTNSEIRENASL